MSTLFIANSGSGATGRGVWRVGPSDYQYQYAAFIPGEDVNLDQVSISTNVYDLGQSAPNNFQVGLYGAGPSQNTPGTLISALAGPSSPGDGAYNSYRPSSTTSLTAGTQYWLGFTLTSDTGGTNSTRVKLSTTSTAFTTLGSGWSVPSMYTITDGVSNNVTKSLVFSLYATPVCFCSGTLIRMASGIERAIDDIAIGDLVATSKGALPVKWIGRRMISVKLLGKQQYQEQLPIKFERGSLGIGVPSRDLYISRSHDVYADGTLVTASVLANGINITNICQAEMGDAVSYLHIEFESEVLVQAQGAWACSYVNTNNRRFFNNYPEFISLYLDHEQSARAVIKAGMRNRQSLAGRKARIKRSWMPQAAAEVEQLSQQPVGI